MIKEFNSLKGILALMIFAHHCPLEFGWKLGLGIIAVTLFFMLSGFLSAVGYRDKIQSTSFSYKQYIIGKAVKFYPLHWLFLLAAIPLSIFSVTNWGEYFATMLLNASLLQSLIPIKPVYFSFNAVSWFLSDTLIFVAIFPFILKGMLNARQITKLILGVTILLVYISAWVFIPVEHTHQFFYINPLFRLLDFVVGIQCGLWFMELKEKHKLSSLIARHTTAFHWLGFSFLIGLTYMATLDDQICFHSIIYLPIACILLIHIGLNGGGYLSSLTLQKIGSISFAFFLAHQIVLRYAMPVLGLLGIEDKYVVTLSSFLISIFVACIVTIYIDKNISLWLKKKINRQSMTAR